MDVRSHGALGKRVKTFHAEPDSPDVPRLEKVMNALWGKIKTFYETINITCPLKGGGK